MIKVPEYKNPNKKILEKTIQLFLVCIDMEQLYQLNNQINKVFVHFDQRKRKYLITR